MQWLETSQVVLCQIPKMLIYYHIDHVMILFSLIKVWNMVEVR